MEFPQLNLPIAALKTKLVNGNTQVFDVVRKKYVKLTPEEWVRQNFIHFLNIEKNYPIGLMGVEKMVKYNNLQTRADIILYNSEGSPTMIVECKAPDVNITQDSFNQIARYNFKLKVEYLVVTNGIRNYCCRMDYEKDLISFIYDFPTF